MNYVLSVYQSLFWVMASDYPDYDSVGSDTESGAQEALAHLRELGHQRIGLIAGLSATRQISHPPP